MDFSKIRKIINDKVLENIYLLALFIYTVKFITKFSLIIDLPNSLSEPIYNTVFALLIFKIVFQKYNLKSFIVTALILILGYVTYQYDPTRNMMVLPLVVVGVKDCDIKKVIKVVFVITTAFILIHTIGYFVDHYINYHSFANLPLFIRDYAVRSTVLCKYYNSYGAIAVMGIMQYLYLCDRDKDRYKKMIVLFVLLLVFYAIGTSRTSTALGILVVLYLALEPLEIFKKNIRLAKILTFVFVFALSIAMMFLDLNSSKVMMLDWLLSGRVELSVNAYNAYGISLWPQLAKIYANPITMDNCVVYLLLTYGLVLFSVLMGLVIYLAIYTKCDNITDYFLIIIFIWALTEHTPIFVAITITPLLVMHNFYSKTSEK